jgi:Peptidase family C25
LFRIHWLLVGVVFGVAPTLLPAQEKADPAQWIVVTAPAFRDALTPLCEQRNANGMHVVIVQTTDVLNPEQVRNGDGGPLKDHVNDLCRKFKGPSYVLLVGAVRAKDRAAAETIVVPALPGVAGRMKGQPSDNAFGLIDKDFLPSVAVGRFPANTVAEAQQMVKKTIAFERDASPGEWRNRLTLLIGNPGGSSPVEKRFAEMFMQSLMQGRLQRVAPFWTGRAIVVMDNSPFFVPKEKNRELSLRYLEEGQLFSVYLGHSAASGFWLGPRLDRKDWGEKNFPGILFSCGCYGCQLTEKDEGYALAAMRNPAGPVAAIGAHGESYSAFGQFAIDGLLDCLSRDNPPQRLGDYWLAIAKGLASAKMDALTFYMYDQADGSRGKTSLQAQRGEHLEMWMLLGDPALRLPLRLPTIRLEGPAAAQPGKIVKVRGSLPAGFKGTALRLTLERPLGSAVPGLEPLPKEPAKASAIIMANHERANSVSLVTRDIQAKDGQFEVELQIPEKTPWNRVIVKAFAVTKDQSALGVLTLPIGK